MATEEQAAATTARFRAAIEAGDVDGFVGTLAPGAVLHSPITDGFAFEGPDEISELMPHVLAVIDSIAYTDDVGNDRTRALFYTARIGTVAVEEATRVRLDDEARVTDITLWFRPLPGLTALVAALGPRLAARNGAAHRLAAAAMTKPMAAMTRSGDKAAVKLVRPRA